MSDNRVKNIVWKYRTYDDLKKHQITEKINKMEEDTLFAYLADLEFARRIIYDKSIDDSNSCITNLMKDLKIAQNCSKEYFVTQLFAAMAYLIKKQARNSKISRINELSERLSRLFCMLQLDQKTDHEYWEAVHKMMMEITGSEEDICCKKLIKEYITTNKNKQKRCIACYKTNAINYIAFSGMIDCNDRNITEAFHCKPNEGHFIKAINDIAKSMDCFLVKTNKKVSLYIPSGAIYSIGNYICNKRFNARDKHLFSCAERKIFSEFKNESGKLMVSFKPCLLCSTAIEYYIRNKVNIEVSWQM